MLRVSSVVLSSLALLASALPQQGGGTVSQVSRLRPTRSDIFTVWWHGPIPSGMHHQVTHRSHLLTSWTQHWTSNSSLPRSTIYAPINPPSQPLPVIVWGEGGCGGSGTAVPDFLIEIASHGFIILAGGPPNGGGSTTDSDLSAAIAWAKQNSGPSPYGNIQGTNIAAAGYSCGGKSLISYRALITMLNEYRGAGLQAYDMNNDVKAIGIFSSGFFDQDANKIYGINKPVFYFLGGTSDIAYNNVSTLPDPSHSSQDIR
jgi:hypothetical protein